MHNKISMSFSLLFISEGAKDCFLESIEEKLPVLCTKEMEAGILAVEAFSAKIKSESPFFYELIKDSTEDHLFPKIEKLQQPRVNVPVSFDLAKKTGLFEDVRTVTVYVPRDFVNRFVRYRFKEGLFDNNTVYSIEAFVDKDLLLKRWEEEARFATENLESLIPEKASQEETLKKWLQETQAEAETVKTEGAE